MQILRAFCRRERERREREKKEKGRKEGAQNKLCNLREDGREREREIERERESEINSGDKPRRS